MIYFSGHGDKNGNLLIDPTKQDEEKTRISMDYLHEAWKNSKTMKFNSSEQPHLLIILDCCFAGNWVEFMEKKKE